MDTPFFPNWRARLAAFGQRVHSLRAQPLPHIQKLFSPILPAGLLGQAETGDNSRERLFSLRGAFWGFLWQMLHPGTSCRKVVRQMKALFCQADLSAAMDQGTGAYCQARLDDLREGLRLGKNHRLMIWRKPRHKPRYLPKALWKRIPAELTVRVLRVKVHLPGFRTKTVTLVTTLSDAQAYPADELAALFMKDLLRVLALDLAPERPGRREPRAVKRRPKPYPLLTEPRQSFQEIPHRSSYRKAAQEESR